MASTKDSFIKTALRNKMKEELRIRIQLQIARKRYRLLLKEALKEDFHNLLLDEDRSFLKDISII